MLNTVLRCEKENCFAPNGKLRYIRCVGIPVVQGDVLKGFRHRDRYHEQELLTRELEQATGIPCRSAEAHPHRQLGMEWWVRTISSGQKRSFHL